MFKKILIANRGEIALRIIRACKELNIKSILVYSEADMNSLPVALADEAVCIGPSDAEQSYLNYKNILSVAEIYDIDAIHPGYGFLSENANFAKICEECNIKFIGPSYKSIQTMGNKYVSKKFVNELGVPVIYGSNIVRNEHEAKNTANKIGFPLMIKSAMGGGGRGIRIVDDINTLIAKFKSSQIETQKSFGDNSLYIEKFIRNAKHIEVQVISDKYGNVVHLGHRDCSLQRRYQKIIEETQSNIDKYVIEKIYNHSITIVKALKYVTVGTLEFLVDLDTNEYFFLEMNTRIQVEHPITEEITGIDIVKHQISLAYGEKLNIKQEDIKFYGHAIECRINAEDPLKNFMPNVGNVNIFVPPGGYGIRIDSHFYSGFNMSKFYDSMICKLITHGTSRTDAITKCKRAIDEFQIEGVKTTLPFIKYLLSTELFNNFNYNTQSVEIMTNNFIKLNKNINR